jgi:MFS family permease
MNPQQQRRSPSVNGGAGQWTVCGILLLATMLNYMDRMALNNMSVRITDELELTQERYGDLEFAFGLAFAAGSLCFGMLADRLSIRWLYPAVVVAWSLVGLLTGLAEGFGQMLACRTMLGFFEAGHWPCALRTTQALLAPERRMFGNSLLQSGGAIGAIVTPLVILALVGTTQAAGAWRLPFLVIGGCGAIWVVAWLVLIGPEPALAGRAGGTAADARGWSAWWEACLGNRRFWALVPFVVGINLTWHLARAWLPKFLQQGRGLSEMQSLLFNSGYYVAADVGCIAAGAAGVWLARSGMSQFGARSLVATACSVTVGLATMAAVSAQGTWMYATVRLFRFAGTLSRLEQCGVEQIEVGAIHVLPRRVKQRDRLVRASLPGKEVAAGQSALSRNHGSLRQGLVGGLLRPSRVFHGSGLMVRGCPCHLAGRSPRPSMASGPPPTA